MSEQKMEFKSFEQKFGLWAEKFKPFIESKEFFDIFQVLKRDNEKDTVLPTHDCVFKYLQKTDPQYVRVVFFTGNPYHRIYNLNKLPQATGIGLDCSNMPEKGNLQGALYRFYEAMDKNLKRKLEHSPSLNYLLEQGVLFINNDLTTKINKEGSHNKLWDSFQKYFLADLMQSTTGVIYVLLGKEAKRFERYIYPLGNYIFKLEHPAEAEKSRREWEHEDIFNKINKILMTNNGSSAPIIWDKQEWEQPLPF